MTNCIDIVRSVLTARGNQNPDGVMISFSDQAVLIAWTGAEPGRTGRVISTSVDAMFKATSGMRFALSGAWDVGVDYFATWTLVDGTNGSDVPVVKGIDHFIVLNEKFDLKGTYRKIASR